MNRRDCLNFATSLLTGVVTGALPRIASAGGQQLASQGPSIESWEAWKAAFLTADGRIVDHLQEDASHSEGQGYGLFLATWFGDASTFRLVRDWTVRFLGVRQDPMLAWRWMPDRTPNVADYNNATDGDLFYAWALLRAGRQFDEAGLTEQAENIARFLAASCLRPDPRGSGRLLLLPGADGFVPEGDCIVNPSYVMPLALRELATAAGNVDLLRSADDGEALLGSGPTKLLAELRFH